jgi:hypothetical protein
MVSKQDIKNFVQGNYLMVKDLLGGKQMDHIKEQALYRAMLCSDCLKAKKCSECGCATPGMFFSPEKIDSKYRWYKMLPKEYWEEFKKIHNITLMSDFKEIMSQENVNKLRYFTPNEFHIQGEVVFDKMNVDFLVKLDEFRHKLGMPVKITSSYRSPEHNAKVGGVKNSFHMLGRAVDIECPSSEYRAKALKVALDMGLTVGIMNTALHIDDRAQQIVFHYYTRYSDNDIEGKING